MITAGILSDTHLSYISDSFKYLAEKAFKNCDIIFHAGDITAPTILDHFSTQIVHAVHGNMCDYATSQQFPMHKTVVLEGHTIGICHGTGPMHNIEDRMWSLFPDVECIIYGHTHRPVCHRKGGVLFINPGSFQCTSPYGAPASYAILQITEDALTAKLHTISLPK